MNDISPNFEHSADRTQTVTTNTFNSEVLDAEGPIAVAFMSKAGHIAGINKSNPSLVHKCSSKV